MLSDLCAVWGTQPLVTAACSRAFHFSQRYLYVTYRTRRGLRDGVRNPLVISSPVGVVSSVGEGRLVVVTLDSVEKWRKEWLGKMASSLLQSYKMMLSRVPPGSEPSFVCG